ncbi:RNA 3'-terminal phosphate cyclase-like protein [Trichoplax sp. H2]|nr:RNA 3'-terminal phosphate cyclase-like protein [Trichoplax sp. H2]|eukprot:RDD45368.1 RNA 3'-terminal phosphate cyclase-like protein [Trichoplax sp. H2]
MPSDYQTRWLTYHGSNFFRQRLLLSTLSGRPVKIVDIRSKDDEPGLQEHEANFIKLLEKMCNGSEIIINHTGTKLMYKPGTINGGILSHDCSSGSRSLGYYLEPILCLAPFCKTALQLTLQGITNGGHDPSVDTIKMVTLKLMEKFGLDEGLELTINKRGSMPKGGGEIFLRCPVVRQLNTVNMLETGKVKKIRGLSYTTRVSPAMANRIIDSCRNSLNPFISDLYIYVDHCKGNQSGLSPGFGVTLTATTTSGVMYSSQLTADVSDQKLPEDIGQYAAYKLLSEIKQGGCIDATHQTLALLMIALGPPDVGKIRTGPLTDYTVAFLRHLKDFFQVMFKIDALTDEESDLQSLVLSCLGINYVNISKKST